MRPALLAIAIALTARGEADTGLPLSGLAQDALTTIDSDPTQSQLDSVFGASASSTLTEVADDASVDVGIRLRAIHALVHYCDPISTSNPACNPASPAHTTLVGLIASTGAASAGADLLVLRAAVETLGPLRVPADTATLIPLLDHASRDIRASTAHALRDLCDGDTTVMDALRQRYQTERVDQVRFAISEALRILGQPPCTAN
ncbi:MAG TPA: HEAT repeat domain-containing protein [Kofleriaceae bacterium]|nr:HEAT repeat domain-containing protein [Kofleriaceae bacterium]